VTQVVNAKSNCSWKHILPVFPVKKFYTEQMFDLVCMPLRNHVDTQPMKRFKLCVIYIRY